jgi:hypothetical protein
MILVIQRKGKSLATLLDQIHLARATISLTPDSIGQQWRFGMQMKSPSRTAVVFMENKKDRDRWFEMTSKMILNLLKSIDQQTLCVCLFTLFFTCVCICIFVITAFLSPAKEFLRELAEITEAENRSKELNMPMNQLSSRTIENPKIVDVINCFQDIVSIELDICQMPIDLSTLMPEYYKSLHHEFIKKLKPRFDLLRAKLKQVDELQQRAFITMKEQNLFSMMEKSITDGLDAITGMKKWVAAFSKFSQIPQWIAFAQQQKLPPDPQVLIRIILAWYLNLNQTWETICDSSILKSS